MENYYSKWTGTKWLNKKHPYMIILQAIVHFLPNFSLCSMPSRDVPRVPRITTIQSDLLGQFKMFDVTPEFIAVLNPGFMELCVLGMGNL